MENRRPFKPATPSKFVVSVAQTVLRANLALSNKLVVAQADLDKVRALPQGAGVVVTPNHADEMDPQVCIELSRLTGRPFVFMCNREAFDEWFGFAGWFLQRLGHFSVERGAHDSAAKKFAVDTVKQALNALVIFPEGEIYYLNEDVQSFHTGAVDICMRAIAEQRSSNASWTAFAVPVAIKYTYTQPMTDILELRVQKMESVLRLPSLHEPLEERIPRILEELLKREELAHQIQPPHRSEVKVSQELSKARHVILDQVQEKYGYAADTQMPVLDASWRVSARLRALIAEQKDAIHREEIKKDLETVEEVSKMASWQPRYLASKKSQDRMAEVVIKMERELYRIKRPQQLGPREVVVRINDPVDLGNYVRSYQQDPHAARHEITDLLRNNIQAMIDEIVSKL